jgi:hypothetical protein
VVMTALCQARKLFVSAPAAAAAAKISTEAIATAVADVDAESMSVAVEVALPVVVVVKMWKDQALRRRSPEVMLGEVVVVEMHVQTVQRPLAADATRVLKASAPASRFARPACSTALGAAADARPGPSARREGPCCAAAQTNQGLGGGWTFRC